MRRADILASNLSACGDAGVAIAASRWGATGLLNVEGVAQDEARGALHRLVRFGKGHLGLKLDAGSALADELPDAITTIVLTAASSQHWNDRVPRVRRSGRRIVLECTSAELHQQAVMLAADAVIAKGGEAGGFVGEETTFVLVQRFVEDGRLPVYAYGGIGFHSAAACCAAGCAGIVLDAPLALMRESSPPETLRTALARSEGDDSICLGAELGILYRAHRRPALAVIDELQRLDQALAETAGDDVAEEWRRAIASRQRWDAAGLWPLGQDSCLAAPLARRYGTVAAALDALTRSVAADIDRAKQLRPLDAGAPMAQSHGTTYPILQGPMTRVSDTAAFAAAVADAGALPFLALALMRGSQVRRLLEETRERLGDRPWGAGILGFVPAELRDEQLAIIREIRPAFALIAGGRPDQAAQLEQDGIPTYLHVPAPGLLRAFLDQGARRFIFEGRECGGHVGPRSSFVLWDTMVEVLLEAIAGGVSADALHIAFAGGIHDARSAAMVSALAAPLAEAGARIGVLIGTGYLFTTEAVECGAIVDTFQREAIACNQTVLFETGPGHAIRCIDTAFYATFRETRRRLADERRSPDEIRDTLESLNLGRLRIASKGIVREETPDGAHYLEVAPGQQREAGMYMVGQVAALRAGVQSIAELHASVGRGSSQLLDAAAQPFVEETDRPKPAPCDVAIVGIGCLLPGARDPRMLWSNILNGVDAITEVPPDRFDVDRYFDADVKARDRVVSRFGGFVGDVPFDPMQYGIPPSALPSIDPVQLLLLEVVRQALGDAGYLTRDYPRARTSVIIGASGGLGELGMRYGLRAALPDYIEDVPDRLVERLPEWTEDSFAGILLNVAAGRVANRFDFGGVNYAVDAACASSLAAIQLACIELLRQTSDMVVVGGVDTGQTPFGYLCFSKSQALSPSGRCRTFDSSADGIAISEGCTALVLKRLADAERDGDRIYGVIKGVAGSSDGRGKGLTAPKPEGQIRALERAYEEAGISPATIGLIEAHGTGTVAGDAAEVAALDRVFTAAGAAPRSCAIGSVKSMVGHTKAAAGITGLAKVALALHHRILPPTLHVEKPNPKLAEDSSPFVVSAVARPWLGNGVPRRAGVSSFGFGGTNFHAVVEEYTGEFVDEPRPRRATWPAELFVWRGTDRTQLAAALERTARALDEGAQPPLAAAAAALCAHAQRTAGATACATIVASSYAELRAGIDTALARLRDGRLPLRDPRGIYVGDGASGAIAFLFPGQGSQEPNMLRQLATEFPHIARSVERADHVLEGLLPRPLRSLIFPALAFTPAGRDRQMAEVTATTVAQPALGAVESGALALLDSFGVRPDMVAGHSYGEYVALCAAGAFDEASLARISELRGRAIAEAVRDAGGTMAAISATADQVRTALGERRGVWIANLNAPQQTVIAGETAAVEQALTSLSEQGLSGRRIPVACAFHTPLMAGARERLADGLRGLTIRRPRVPVFSNALGDAYPADPAEILRVLEEHLISPVRFVDEIRAMHAAGARVFVEIGPKSVLTGLTRQILGDSAVVIPLDAAERDGLLQLLHVLGQLAASGAGVATAPLFAGRQLDAIDPQTLRPLAAAPAAAWVVNGSGARRVQDPVPSHARVKLAAPAAPAPSALPSIPAASVPLAPIALQANEPMAPADAVVLQFQRVMAQFLDMQGRVMSGFLGAPAGSMPMPTAAPMAMPATFPLPVADVAPPPSTPAPSVVPSATVHATVSASSAEDVPALVTRIASERTGYPPEMLDPALNMEADLGIDSIKRVEILSAIRRECPPAAQSRMQAAMDRLTSQRTLGDLAREIAAALGNKVVAADVEVRPHVRTVGDADAQPAAASPQVDVAALLISIVAERTGYPADMLDPDLNIEADLGIDSIKRVEILSAFRRQSDAGQQPLLQHAMDSLTTRKTLRELTRAIEAALGAGASAVPAGPATADEPARLVMATIDAPPLQRTAQTGACRVCLITDDSRGVSAALAGYLARRGDIPIVLRHSDKHHALSPTEFAGDWSDARHIRAMLDEVRRAHGPVATLIHTAPLDAARDFATLSPADWQRELRRHVTTLYALVREGAGDLESSAARVVVATGCGGTLGCDVDGATAPTQAGAAAWVRTAAIEMPAVRFRVVDMSSTTSAGVCASRLVEELDATDDVLEIGYVGDRRLTAVPRLAALETPAGAEPAVDASWVFVITGGARGITGLLSRELATRYRPTLVLAGSSPLPAEQEPAATASLRADELKAAVTASLRREGVAVRPVDVETAVQRLLRDREIRDTLAACRRAGARVEYHQVDVRSAAFETFINGVYETHGRIDGFVHGAGVIEDKLLRDKTSESFDRVVGTKAVSVHTLARTLRPSSLRLLLLMSSITAVFGNRGQADYGAANGIMNGTAAALAARWPGRVVAMNWGPWDTLGMASPGVRKQFEARGIVPIDPAAGVRAMLREIAAGGRENAVVVIGTGPWCAQDRAAQVEIPA